MLLRSSSTPLLGSLVSSILDSPNCHHQSELHTKHAPSPIQKLSCTNSVAEIKPQGFRKVQSEGNLESLTNDSSIDEFKLQNKIPRSKVNRRRSLETIPSFSNHENGDDEEEIVDGEIVNAIVLKNKANSVNGYGSWGFESEGKMYLATGPGISGISYVDNGGYVGGGNGGGYRPVAFDRDGGGGDNSGLSMEEYYKKMLAGNPGNPLFLRNYAHFLHQTKGDLPRAEEYYSRAVLADPDDGEILSQYAKLIWELHQDKERAAHYFERAVRASSEDSHIHAAYASFLWNIEDDEEIDEDTAKNSRFKQPILPHGIMASASA